MNAVYFVRQLGKVRGPFAPDHLNRLVASGLVGPAAEVSTDRSRWRPLADHAGAGGEPEPIPQRPTVRAPAPDDYELDLSAILPSALPAEAGTGSEWFDGVDLGAMGDV
jgi:hypothetical protein